MKTKYIIISLLVSFYCLTIQAIIPINQTDIISVTTEYIDNASLSWIVTKTDPNKPLLINYSIGTEYGFDFVKIYNVDSNNADSLLVSLSGMQTGSISSVIPTGKIKITFTSDGSVCYQTSPVLCSGIQISFTPDNSYPSSAFANSYISGNSIVNGNVGIGVVNPSYKLEVNGTAKFLDNIQCKNSISFSDNACFTVPKTIITDLRTNSFTMPHYGIAAPGAGGSSDLWLSGHNSIRMFTAGITMPAVTILQNGNMGLGIINPQAKLDVQKAATENGNDLIANFQRTADNTGGSGIVRIGNHTTADLEINSGYSPTGQRFGTFADFNIVNNTPGGTYGGINFVTNATTRMTVKANGNVGIGTTSPASPLTIIKTPEASDSHLYFGDASAVSGAVSSRLCFAGFGIQHAGFAWVPNSNVGEGKLHLSFGGINNPMGNPIKVTFQSNGNVGIGTTKPTHLLSVNGTIRAKEVIVDLCTDLADFVFHPSYSLMPLHEVEQYVKTNSHLPEIPSAAEVSKNGMSIGDMQNKLLQKIEELTLYVIEQEKKIERLEKGQR